MEILTGLKTLNVSASSYGTPREFKLFERVDRSGLQYVVLQYSGNDHVETQYYIERGLTLPGYEEKGWKLWVKWYQGHRRYVAGKYLAYSLAEVIRAPLKAAFSGDAGDSSGSHDRSRVSEGHAVRLILEEFNEMLSGVQTYVIEPGQPAGGFSFLQRLDEELSQSATLRQCCAIETVDLSDTLTREDRFVLDGHLRASGHVKIASRLAALMNAGEQRSGASAAP